MFDFFILLKDNLSMVSTQMWKVIVFPVCYKMEMDLEMIDKYTVMELCDQKTYKQLLFAIKIKSQGLERWLRG